MATETKDGEISPMSRSPRELSPGAQGDASDNGGLSKKTRFYVPSPLRSQVQGKELPTVPKQSTITAVRQPPQPMVRFQAPIPESFPFNAEPGSVGPSPTTNELVENTRPIISSSRSSPMGLGRKRAKISGTATPPDQRVQFARERVDDAPLASPTRSNTWDTDDEGDGPHTSPRQESFFGKLKALATPAHSNHTRSASGSIDASHSFALSPQSERSEPTYQLATEPVEEDAEADEEYSGEGSAAGETIPRKRRKSRRPRNAVNTSSPGTPRASRLTSFMRDHTLPRSSSRPAGPSRRATTSDTEDGGRGGVSEDEGRDKIRNAFRRGIEGARGLSYAARRNPDGETPDGKRPGNLRRITGLGGGDGVRQHGDRHNSTSAQKWRQVKAGLKMIGQRKKEERMRVDHQKSALLMAELLAGAPAALFFASMFQRDEHQHRKVPVLLEQLKISISDVKSNTDKKGDRDVIYRIDLEYGNGPARLQWTIYRSVNDFVNLHVKYKAHGATDKVRHLRSDDKSKAKIPRFPKSVIPYARGLRGLLEKVQDEDDEQEATSSANVVPNPLILANGSDSIQTEGNASPAPKRPNKHKRRLSSFAPPRRMSTGEIGSVPVDPDTLNARQREQYTERSRQKLETYLQQMIRWLIFRPDSTRLCKFLEVSAMAIRLSAEGGYQGKQGLLQIASRRHRELRRITLDTFGPSAFKERHKRRWFLVRHSYIVCVDGPESLTPYDVFLVDSNFSIEKRGNAIEPKTVQDVAKIAVETATPAKKAHIIRLYNAERKLKLYARNEKQYIQFKESLTQMMENTVWSKQHRFDSFAPVRSNVWARWLVDGRDHMWQVSRAIDNARDFIYIHDWWLSPDLYMRRPAAISQKWRLDRLLQRKAEEGVKIFVIVYRNIESAIPIDSEYTKWSLLDLHPNICVQRSPNQFRQNQFFWAHHEKLVVVDNMMAFVGGVDLCFGRWDDPCHSLTDDKLTGFEEDLDVPRDSEHCQMWPGKDYSNPRVQDFYALDRPYEEMYDRTKVPRMPWHDISMQLVGQPARDVARHFVQRWNYVLRSRVPSRPTPILMPPPEYERAELDRLGMTGTCQIQILRSCAPWSIGTPNKVEHSIMNAYCELIKHSDHFIYIENQFYISSCTLVGTKIHNLISDAIVERIIRAHENNETWQACLVIPLMPGFQNSIDSQEGTSIRLIMLAQYKSICRGEDSIWGRLKAQNIEPLDYIRFYSLRQWGKIGPRKCLTTEQLYIHAKCMVVDDRTAIIGSANINERSMLGSRDSEVAAVVTDTRMIPSFMGGKPYEVGEFPHTLRKRLQREHLGIDVDAIYRREQVASQRAEEDAEMNRIYRNETFVPSKEYFETPPSPPAPRDLTQTNLQGSTPDSAARKDDAAAWAGTTQVSSNSSQQLREQAKESKEPKKELEHDLDVDGYGKDNTARQMENGNGGLRDTFVDAQGREVLISQDAPDTDRLKVQEGKGALHMAKDRDEKPSSVARPPWPMERMDTYILGLAPRSQLPELPALDDTDIGGPPLTRGMSASSQKVINPLISSMRRPEVHEDCMTDPIATNFYHDIWHQVAENNTRLYRQVFRCQPDSEATDWHSYEKFNEYSERFMQSQGLGSSKAYPVKGAPGNSGPPGSVGADFLGPIAEKMLNPDTSSKKVLAGLMNKLRPGSRAAAAETKHTREAKEKLSEKGPSPDSPGSGLSSQPTAVPSPDHAPLDEKEAAKQVDAAEKTAQPGDGNNMNRRRTVQYTDDVNDAPETTATQSSQSPPLEHSTSQKRRRRATTKSSVRPGFEDVLGREEAEDLLKLVQGHLVLWPYDWLEKEERSDNWLYNIDQIAPMEIYD